MPDGAGGLQGGCRRPTAGSPGQHRATTGDLMTIPGHMTIPDHDTPATAFTRLLGCRTPLQQAPMGAVSGPRLATAVADAGGVGTLSATGWSAPDLADRLDEVV